MKYLTKRGIELFEQYKKYAKDIGLDIPKEREDEIAMLANNQSIYEELAEYCRKNGTTQKTPKSDYRQTSPEFSNMTRASDAVLKHLDKLGFYKVDNKEIEDSNPISDILKKSN